MASMFNAGLLKFSTSLGWDDNKKNMIRSKMFSLFRSSISLAHFDAEDKN